MCNILYNLNTWNVFAIKGISLLNMQYIVHMQFQLKRKSADNLQELLFELLFYNQSRLTVYRQYSFRHLVL